MNAGATFSPRRHLYREGDQVVPSVTQVLELAGLDDTKRIPLHHLERAAALGTAVHQACEFLDQGDLDLASLDEEVAGHVLAYQNFKKDSRFVVVKVEERGIAGEDLKFGYCVDRIGLIGDELVLLDLKTASKKMPWWGVQTAGYADALRHEGTRAALHLAGDGKYKLLRHEDEHDFEVWRGALVLARWLLAHGRKIPR